jgi:hypothetical protein
MWKPLSHEAGVPEVSERHVVVVSDDALAAHRLEERRALERFHRLELRASTP